MSTPVVLLGIDWSELRNQKATLLAVINNMVTDVSNDKDTNEQIIAERDDLQGILNLIDSLQDYATEELGIEEIHVYDFELEEHRETETPEELFARENASTIFQMHIEGTGLYEDEEMSVEFIKSIIDDPMHASAIKNLIRTTILDDVKLIPENFLRDNEGKLRYDFEMYDYGFAIEQYCRVIFRKDMKKKLWLCWNCGSDEVELKMWVNPNTNKIGNDCDEPEGWCRHCIEHHKLLLTEMHIDAVVTPSK